MVDTHAPSPASLSDDTKQALDALLNARVGGQDDPKLAAALGQAVKDDVGAQRYGEAEARAYLRVYSVPYPEDEAKQADPPKAPEHHAENDKKAAAPKAKA